MPQLLMTIQIDLGDVTLVYDDNMKIINFGDVTLVYDDNKIWLDFSDVILVHDDNTKSLILVM